MRRIQKVGIVGGGAMGVGIARLLVRNPQHIPVVVLERSDEEAQRACQRICEGIDGVVAKEIISSGEGELQKSLVSVTAKYEDLKNIDCAIEAVWEDIAAKQAVFEALDASLPSDVILASNTSGSFTISQLAAFASRPDRFIGIHFFNPPTRLPLVEIIRGAETSQETCDAVFTFVQDVLGKSPILVADRIGFLVDPMLLPYLNEAALGLEEADIDPLDIDEEAQNFGWPMGPFVLLDAVVGLDVASTVATALYKEYGERMKPAQLLLSLADQKRFGLKSGAGVYIHDLAREDELEPIGEILARLFPDRRSDVTAADIFERMMIAMINEAARCLEEGVASCDDIEIACVAGIAFPAERGGILHYADELGLKNVVARLEELEACCGSRFSPAQILRDKAKEDSTFFEEW